MAVNEASLNYTITDELVHVVMEVADFNPVPHVKAVYRTLREAIDFAETVNEYEPREFTGTHLWVVTMPIRVEGIVR